MGIRCILLSMDVLELKREKWLLLEQTMFYLFPYMMVNILGKLVYSIN